MIHSVPSRTRRRLSRSIVGVDQKAASAIALLNRLESEVDSDVVEVATRVPGSYPPLPLSRFTTTGAVGADKLTRMATGAPQVGRTIPGWFGFGVRAGRSHHALIVPGRLFWVQVGHDGLCAPWVAAIDIRLHALRHNLHLPASLRTVRASPGSRRWDRPRAPAPVSRRRCPRGRCAQARREP